LTSVGTAYIEWAETGRPTATGYWK